MRVHINDNILSSFWCDMRRLLQMVILNPLQYFLVPDIEVENGAEEEDLEDEDDMFKSARAIEPEPVKREVNIFGDENSDTDAVELDNSTPDKEIPLEDEDEKPFEVLQSA